jgi:hypothetical protein
MSAAIKATPGVDLCDGGVDAGSAGLGESGH